MLEESRGDVEMKGIEMRSSIETLDDSEYVYLRPVSGDLVK